RPDYPRRFMLLRETFESHSRTLGEETTNALRTSRMGDSGRNTTRFLGGAALGAVAIPPEFVCPDHLWGHKVRDGLPVANGPKTTLSRKPALTLASPDLLHIALQIRLPRGVPVRLREEPNDLLARAGSAEAIAEVVVAEQPRD